MYPRIAALFSALLCMLLCTGCGEMHSGTYETVQAYIESPMMQELLAFEAQHPKEDTGWIKEVRAEENTVIYIYTFEEPLNLSDPAKKARVQAALEEGCRNAAADHAAILTDLRGIVEEKDTVALRVIYKNTDGSEIFTYEYTE